MADLKVWKWLHGGVATGKIKYWVRLFLLIRSGKITYFFKTLKGLNELCPNSILKTFKLLIISRLSDILPWIILEFSVLKN